MPAGRPTKYNDKRCAKIIALLKRGNTRKAAAGSAGVTYETFRAWLADPQFSSFSADVDAAEDYAEQYYADIIRRAAGPRAEKVTKTVTKPNALGGTDTETTETTQTEIDWHAAESWLKRRRRAEWGDQLNLTNLTTEQLAALGGVSKSDDQNSRTDRVAGEGEGGTQGEG